MVGSWWLGVGQWLNGNQSETGSNLLTATPKVPEVLQSHGGQWQDHNPHKQEIDYGVWQVDGVVDCCGLDLGGLDLGGLFGGHDGFLGGCLVIAGGGKLPSYGPTLA